MLAVLTAFHLAFIFFILPVVLASAAQQGAALPLAVRGYLVGSRFMVAHFFPLGSMVLVATLGWLLGLHLMLRRHPRAQWAYARIVYFVLALILAVVMTLSMAGRAGLLGDPLQY
jgi:hypothetical protein